MISIIQDRRKVPQRTTNLHWENAAEEVQASDWDATLSALTGEIPGRARWDKVYWLTQV